MKTKNPTPEEVKKNAMQLMKAYASGLYDLQDLRIRAGSRVVAAFKTRLGQKPGEKESAIGKNVDFHGLNEAELEEARAVAAAQEKEAFKMLNAIRADYKRITDGMAAPENQRKLKAFFGDKNSIIHSEQEFILVRSYIDLLEKEERAFREADKYMSFHPAFPFLKNVTGIGPALRLSLLSSLDIHKARHPSSFWKYCGIDVLQMHEYDGFDDKGRKTKKYSKSAVPGSREVSLGRRNWKTMASTKEYVNKDGDKTTKLDLGYNPWLKAKLCGVAAECLVKCGLRFEKEEAIDATGKKTKKVKEGGEVVFLNKYAKLYYDYKHRLKTNPKHANTRPIVIEKMAKRYMIKQLLVDLHIEWSKAEGLPVSLPYHEAKHGYTHGVSR